MINILCSERWGYNAPTANPMSRGDGVSLLTLTLACFFSYEALGSYHDMSYVPCASKLSTLRYLKNIAVKPHFMGLCCGMDPII